MVILAARLAPFVINCDDSCKNDKLAALIKEYGRMKYGRKKIFVNQKIEDRIGISKGYTSFDHGLTLSERSESRGDQEIEDRIGISKGS